MKASCKKCGNENFYIKSIDVLCARTKLNWIDKYIRRIKSDTDISGVFISSVHCKNCDSHIARVSLDKVHKKFQRIRTLDYK